MTCDPGYELEGDVETECSDGLEWTGVMPLCVGKYSSRSVNPEQAVRRRHDPRRGGLAEGENAALF